MYYVYNFIEKIAQQDFLDTHNSAAFEGCIYSIIYKKGSHLFLVVHDCCPQEVLPIL